MELLSNLLGGSVWACWTFVLTLVTVPLAAASDRLRHEWLVQNEKGIARLAKEARTTRTL